MHYYTPDQLPAISLLARSFAVSDQWRAPAPCQIWPNRFFVHSACRIFPISCLRFFIALLAPDVRQASIFTTVLANNHLQRSLYTLSAHLPQAGTDVLQHLDALGNGSLAVFDPVHVCVADAEGFLRTNVESFLGKF